jgi:hypothetical protein
MITANQGLMKIRIAMIAIALIAVLVLLVLRARGEQASSSGSVAGATTQSAAAQSPATNMPAAKPEDVKSIDAIIAATYDVISGPAGDRDWNRFKSLFIPEARLIPVGMPQGATTARYRVLSPDDYVSRAGNSFKQNGFFENEVSRKQEQYGHIAHVFSTYESRHAKGEKPFARGINSFTLFNDGQRWYVVQIMWDAENPSQPIPEKYLK